MSISAKPRRGESLPNPEPLNQAVQFLRDQAGLGPEAPTSQAGSHLAYDMTRRQQFVLVNKLFLVLSWSA